MNDRFPAPDEAIAAQFRPDLTPPDLQPAPFHLRVISGPQTGAIHDIPPGRILIGSDLQSDIVLRCRTDAVQRALVSRLDEGIAITAVAGAIKLNGSQITTGETIYIKPGDRIMVADVALEFLGSEVEWTIPEAPPDEKAAVVATESDKVNDEPSISGALVPILIAVALVLLIATMHQVALHADSAAHQVSELPERTAVVDKESVRKLLGNAGFDHLEIAPGEGNMLILDGYVDNQRELNRIPSILGGSARRVISRVQSIDTLLTAAREMLQVCKVAGNVRFDAGGRFTIGVNPSEMEAALRCALNIMKDVQGIRSVSVIRNDRITSGEKIQDSILVERSPEGGVVVVDSRSIQIREIFKGKDKIAYVDFGKTPSIQTVGGRKIFEGGQVNDSTAVIKIRPGVLTLKINGVERIAAAP